MKWMPSKSAIAKEAVLTVVSVVVAMYFTNKIKSWAEQRKRRQ